MRTAVWARSLGSRSNTAARRNTIDAPRGQLFRTGDDYEGIDYDGIDLPLLLNAIGESLKVT
jgi:hypothetical protein